MDLVLQTLAGSLKTCDNRRMFKLELKKSAHIVLFDGVIFLLAIIFLMPVSTSVVMGTVISSVGVAICFWSKRYVFTRKNFSVAGPYRFVRYPYLLGHFIFVFGLIIHVRSFTFLVVTVILLGLVYSRIIRYAEGIKYGNADANYIFYRSSVSAIVPQLLPFARSDQTHKVQIIDFMSILVNDSYTELFRMISLGIVVGTSVIMMSSNDMWISKIISMTFVSVFYMYRLSQEYRTQKRNTSSN